MMKERVGFFASFNERLRKLFPYRPGPGCQVRHARKDGKIVLRIPIRLRPPSPMVSKEGEFVWKESQRKSETR